MTQSSYNGQIFRLECWVTKADIHSNFSVRLICVFSINVIFDDSFTYIFDIFFTCLIQTVFLVFFYFLRSMAENSNFIDFLGEIDGS